MEIPENLEELPDEIPAEVSEKVQSETPAEETETVSEAEQPETQAEEMEISHTEE